MSQVVKIEPEWRTVLQDYLSSPAFKQTANFVRDEYLSKTIYPKPADVFRAFWLTPFSKVRVVILGQDPYHNPGQAHGLSFSVPDNILVPPSLKNIYKEIEQDLKVDKSAASGNLELWAKQGVLLLNAILTVVAHSPASHQKRGWEQFTDTVIKTISDKGDKVVFLLWGSYARSKKTLINSTKHLVLEAPHPSPLSAYNGFLGCRHFSRCNEYLRSQGRGQIDW